MNTMLTVNAALWIMAVICFALAVILPFTGRKAPDGTDIPPWNTGRFSLIAGGLLCAALTHVLRT